MAEVLGKDLDLFDDSMITDKPFNLATSEVDGPKFITGADLARSARISKEWKDPVAIPAQASIPYMKLTQPTVVGTRALIDSISNTMPNMANELAQLAVQFETGEEEKKNFLQRLGEDAGTESLLQLKPLMTLAGIGLALKDLDREEIKERAKTYNELIDLLDNRDYPSHKFAKRVIADTTAEVESRRMVRELYRQAGNIDSSKWYNQAGEIIGAMTPALAIGRGAFGAARAFGAGRVMASRIAQNVAKGYIGVEMAGQYAEETAAQYLERTGDKNFENFTANDATGLTAAAYGAIGAQIEFMGGVEPIFAGALNQVGLKTGLLKAGVITGTGETIEEWLQNLTEFLSRKIDGTTEKTWREGFMDSLKGSGLSFFIGGSLGMVGHQANRANLVKGIKQAIPNITDTQAQMVADTMIENVAEISSQDPTLRANLREKVALMYRDTDIDNKENIIDATTDLEYGLIAMDSAERGIDIAENPIFAGEVNELGWFRDAIPENRRAEVQALNDEIKGLKDQLAEENKKEEKNWEKIDELENKLAQANQYILEKLSDLARNDAAAVRRILQNIENKYVIKEKKKSGVFFQADLPIKEKQLELLLEKNPMRDDYHTGIRTLEDIKTLEEVLLDKDFADYEEFTPDLTRRDIEKAIQAGKIKVYSSYPIEVGTFITPSKIEAESYSGSGKIYSKTINITDAAWIDPIQGEYAPVIQENNDATVDGFVSVDGKEPTLLYSGMKGARLNEIDPAPMWLSTKESVAKKFLGESDNSQMFIGFAKSNKVLVVDGKGKPWHKLEMPEELGRSKFKWKTDDIKSKAFLKGYDTVIFKNIKETESLIGGYMFSNTADTIVVKNAQEQLVFEDEVLYQNRVSGAAPKTYRGAYIPEYRFILRANRMDASTLSHELAHDWMEVNFDRFRSGKASKEFMRAWGALEKALGIEENATQVPRKASETFARAYEAWIMTNEDWAKLINVDDKDKDAIEKLLKDYQGELRNIYNDMTSKYFKDTWGKLGELKPELKAWFDRAVNITDLDVLVERGEITKTQAETEKLNRTIDTVIENTADEETAQVLKTFRTLNDTNRYEVEGGNINALQDRLANLAREIDENNLILKEKYDTRRDMLAVAEAADNFVKTRLDDALAIINGEMAEVEGLYKEDIYTALERLAIENGDLGLIDELKNSEIANRLAKELGQRVAGFRNFKNSTDIDVVSALKSLDNRFNKALENKKAKQQYNETLDLLDKELKNQDKIADKQLDKILKDLECK